MKLNEAEGSSTRPRISGFPIASVIIVGQFRASMLQRRTWITGGAGLIASYLVRDAARWAPDIDPIALQRPEFDLLDPAGVEAAFKRDRPDLVIHCAAMSRTGDCQARPDLSRRINVEATSHLAAMAADIPFIFFSSDLVFDVEKGHYTEVDPPNPRSVYGDAKAEAERNVLRNPGHTVIRTSLNAGISRSGSRAFNEELRVAWESGRTLALFSDEYRCPIAAAVTARAVWEIVLGGFRGLLHLAGAERVSRLEIGQLLAARWPHLTPRFEAMSVRNFAGPARSPDTSLDCSRLQARLTFALPRFSSWLTENSHEAV